MIHLPAWRQTRNGRQPRPHVPRPLLSVYLHVPYAHLPRPARLAHPHGRADGDRPLRHRHVPAGVPDDRGQSGRAARRRGAHAGRLPDRTGAGAGVLRPDGRPLRPQAAAAGGPGAVHAGFAGLRAGRLGAGPDRLARAAGHGRGGRHRDPARRHSRPLRNPGSGARHVAADADHGTGADPCSAGRRAVADDRQLARACSG